MSLLDKCVIPTIRCPKCKRYSEIVNVNIERPTIWEHVFMQLPGCPHCGHVFRTKKAREYYKKDKRLTRNMNAYEKWLMS